MILIFLFFFKEILLLVSIAVLVFFLSKHYFKSFIWAQQFVYPLQNSLNRWNHHIADWMIHYKPTVWVNKMFLKFHASDKKRTYNSLFTGTLSPFVKENKRVGFSKNKEYEALLKTDEELLNEIKTLHLRLQNKGERIVELINSELNARQKLYKAQVRNDHLEWEVNKLRQLGNENIVLSETLNSLQNELNEVFSKLTGVISKNEQLVLEVERLKSIERDLFNVISHNKDGEKQIEKISFLENDVRSLTAEREILLLQVQEIKMQKHHEYGNLLTAYKTILEEKSQLQDKVVLLEREVAILSRNLNAGKQKLNESALWEDKFIKTAKELHQIQLLYASIERELSILRNKEQLLRKKANLADGLQEELRVRLVDIAVLQQQLFECRKNK
ncbi:MAG TPA: hypothetical protein VFN30_10935 [Chitinophagaceae bacterium]|nr:hypothetical protein [Chitinophagaceae bacterium]